MIRMRVLAVVAILAMFSRGAYSEDDFSMLPELGVQEHSRRATKINIKTFLSPKTFYLPMPNFDQGISCIAQPSQVIAIKADAVQVADFDPQNPKSLGPIPGAHLGAILRYNANHQRASALLADPRFVYVEPVQQQLLQADFRNLTTERDGMLPKADGLDAQNAAFVRELDALNKERAALLAEKQDYDRQVIDHNRICNPAPDESTYQWCLKDAARLKQWLAVLLQKAEIYNKKVDDYNKRYSQFSSVWDAFVAIIRIWENKVINLSQRIQNALNNATGACTAPQFGDLHAKYENACRGALPKCDNLLGCADIARNMRRNQACADAANKINQTCFGGASGNEYSDKANEALSNQEACQTLFASKCGGWDPINGKCDKDLHSILQGAVDAACDRERSCNRVEYGDCIKLRDYWRRNSECYAARVTIAIRCYDGGDQGHKQAIQEAQNSVIECDRRLNIECPLPPSK